MMIYDRTPIEVEPTRGDNDLVGKQLNPNTDLIYILNPITDLIYTLQRMTR